ncbi:MAG: sensor histidine kinase [Desulfatiglandales bacterium]
MLRHKLAHVPYYRSLVRNMFLTIIIVSFIPVFLVSVTIYYQFWNSYRKRVYAHLSELVIKHEQQINGFLSSRLADIRYLSKSFGYEKLSNDAFLMERLYTLQKEYGPVFVDLGVVTAQGSQVSYAGPFKLGKAHYSDAQWFQKALADEYVISDVFLGLRGLPHFIVAVKNYHQGEPWLLRATIDFVAFNNLVNNIRLGRSGFAFILNRDGKPQTTPLQSISLREGCYGGFFSCDEESPLMTNIEERPDDEGKKSIFVTALLKERDWVLVYKQETEDAFSDLHRAEKISVIIFFLGGVCIVTMAILLSIRMVSRIVTADSEKEIMNRQVIETGKLASVGELAAGVAHEINNPVAIMVEEAGWIEDLVLEGDSSDTLDLEEIKRSLKQINLQGKRCKDITQKLLSFSRGTDSKIKDLQINQVIEDVYNLSSQRAKFANIEIRKRLQENLPEIPASETEMNQVFLNLINNALYEMEKTGGTIDITTFDQDGNIVIEIADTGPGIPAPVLERIFDPFFTTKPVGQGTGLGLSICYGIITKMNGQIKVSSEVGRGTRFQIQLPIPGTTTESKET